MTMTIVHDVVQQLDQMEREPSEFEAGVLETVMRQLRHDHMPSKKQHAILCQMVDRYLRDPYILKALMEVAPNEHP